MADHVLETRILLRYGTFTQWMNSEVILRQGEAAIVAFPSRNTLVSSDDTPLNTPPAIGIKIGDGTHYFEELPWVQGVAADVYSWAKESTKPTYSASEIEGLTEFINNAGSGGGSSGGTSASTYRIIYDSNNKKYILQYYDEEEEDWVNASGEVNLSEIYNRINTIERWANGARVNLGNIESPIIEYIYDEITTYINRMDYPDVDVAHQFVTSVVQENGQISVTRSAISASDITSGILTTAQGGTGLNYVDEDEVLVGDTNGNITTMRFVTQIDDETLAFATVGAIRDYVNSRTAGLTGAMHFIGESSVNITITPPSHADPNISGYDFKNAQLGDVILANNAQEFVWTGSYWRLLGDEGSYAIKGSIVNADISDNAAIAQSKINGLAEALEGKVDVEVGKGLSSNDYTTEEKTKLANIEDGAQTNVIEHILLNDVEAIPHTVANVPKTVELSVKEFDDTSRAKLATIEENAQVNSIESISLNGTVQVPDNNKQINLVVNALTPEEKAKLDGIEAGAQVNVIEHIYLNDTELIPDSPGKRIDINITGITQEQIEKLNGIEAGAQVNTIEGIIYDNTRLYPDQNGIISIDSDPHTEHENVIESIYINGIEQEPDNNKSVNITIDQAALNLDVVAGAQVPKESGIGKDEVDQIQKKLQFERIAITGDVKNLLQTNNTYIILDCGSSTDVV